MKSFLKYTVYIITAFMFQANCLEAQTRTAAKPAASSAKVLPFDPDVKLGKLPNGFTYYIRRNTEPKDRAVLYLATKVGSVLENDDQRGLAHFMEHMSFNGTKNYPKNELVNYLQKSGVRFGADLNAYTSFDQTVYQLPIPTDDPEVFRNGMQIMRDWAQDASLDPEEIEKERGVVLEEKRLGKGAQERMQNKYLPVIFNNSRYSNRLPIGTEEVLKNFKPAVIQSFYKDWYRPNLQALIVVGDIDVAKVEQMIKSEFADLKSPASERPRTKYTIPLINKNQFVKVTDAEMPVIEVEVLFKHPEMIVKNTTELRKLMIRSLYNQMMGARFSELSKQADPPFVQGGSSIGGFLAGLDAASAIVVAKPGELERGFKAVWTEIARVKKFGYTESELARAKESFMTYQESLYKEKDKTSSEEFVEEYLEHFINGQASPGKEYEYNFYKQNIGGIKLADVNELAKQYITDLNRDIIILAPDKEKDALPDETQVNKWISDVEASKITAYVDQVSDKPLLPVKPTAGTILSENKIPEIGVTELTLSNGVKVVLKPTDFKNDEINFSAFSPGGSSLYSDDDYPSAGNAAAIISRNGVGEYNSVQLTKYLTGKQASVLPYISERFEGINGFATPKDLELGLQLIYLYFTQPRKDTEIFKGLIAQQKASLANRNNNPNAVFSDTVSAVLGNYNIRRTGPSVEKLDRINLDKAFDVYKDRFADASDFTFTFVGSFETEKIKPLLQQYLSALPSTNRKESAKDLHIYPPSGKISKEVDKGLEPKSTVRLYFTGDYQFSDRENNQMEALAEVLSIKLIERLREDEGGVYGVGATASYSKYPKGRYSFAISFGCAPENVEKLITSAMDEINKIKQNGALQVDIDKFTAEEKRSTEVHLKENGFWASYLAGQYQNNEDVKQVLTYISSLKEITPQSLKATANKYLSGDNLIRFVLMPETKTAGK